MASVSDALLADLETATGNTGSIADLSLEYLRDTYAGHDTDSFSDIVTQEDVEHSGALLDEVV